jgi:hypothetical protein
MLFRSVGGALREASALDGDAFLAKAKEFPAAFSGFSALLVFARQSRVNAGCSRRTTSTTAVKTQATPVNPPTNFIFSLIGPEQQYPFLARRKIEACPLFMRPNEMSRY